VLVRARPQERLAREEARLRASLRFVWERPRLLALLLMIAAVGFASDPVNTEAPAFASAFGYPDTVAGIIIGLFGAGAVTAALFLAGRPGSPRFTVFTLLLLSAGIIAFSLSPSLLVAAPFLLIAGFGYLASNARATTQLQLEVDETQRGRVMALWSVAFLGLRPFASLVDGALAAAVGVRFAGVVLALPALLAAVLIARRIRAGVVSPPSADDRRDRDADVAEPVREIDVKPV
jgi:MFS family permease